jgi:outer membrane receptor protein involved in Fe transport
MISLHISPRPCLLVALFASLTAQGTAAAGEPVVALAPYVITAVRAPQALERLPLAVDVFEAARLQGAPSRTLDDTLRESAAFSLFRRSGSLIANPTAQGVSLRNVGPSGASRSLVLLDGIPLNDPFGGWVAWSSISLSSLDRVEIVRGGGSGAWGNSALSGIVQLFSAAPDRRSGAVTATGGDFGLKAGEASASTPVGHGFLALNLAAFSVDGFRVVDSSQRGPVDEALGSRQHSARLAWRGPVGSQATLQLSGRYFREKRGNGTPLQKNDSESGQVAATLSGTTTGQLGWQATAYYQEQSFASFFSSVNAARTAETPANDQFDVPATAGGASFSFVAQGDRSRTSGGADLRWVKGETRERFLFAAGQFTRLRRAGGEQSFLGAFLNHDRALADTWRGSLGVRLDSWWNRDGHRRESDLATGALVRDDHYASRSGLEFSPQLGLVWTPSPGQKWRGAAYQAFRVPTLNEYYRPFRVGAVTTEANAALERERLTGAELGLEFSRNTVRLTATTFANELRDAVGNVTQSPTSRLRLNLDRVRIQGLELGGEWRPASRLRVHADAILSEAQVRAAAVRPALEGLRLAQTPRLTLASGIDWQATPTWKTAIGVRYVGGQFEDDENSLWLAPVAVLNVGVTKRLGDHFEVNVSVENLLDRRIETGRSADGIVTLGPPRMARLGLRWMP